MKGKNDSTPFLPLKVKTGGKVTYVQNKEAMCLTEKQTDHVYKAIEECNMINTKTITCESMRCETNQGQDDNPYKRVVLNNVFKELDKSPEMKSWSIFSDNVRYIQHDQMMSQNLNIDTLDYRDHKQLYLKLKEEERETLDIDFGLYPDFTKPRYLDVYEGVYAEMMYANKFNENSDLSTTYLGQIGMKRDTKIKAEERFPITGQGFASGKLLDGNRMSNSIKHRCYKVIHVEVVLFAMQDSTCVTQILFKHTKNPSGKRTICQCTFCNPSDYRHTWT